MSEMVNRIAAVLKNLPVRDRSEPGGELDELRLREAARAVLVEMREPTEAMRRAGDLPGWDDSVTEGLSGEVWRAMIDKALSEDSA